LDAVPQQQQEDEKAHQQHQDDSCDQRSSAMTMAEWDQANPKLTERNWLTEHMDRILAGGLRRYKDTSKSPPDLLDPTDQVLMNLIS
jgi:hypothetical protein